MSDSHLLNTIHLLNKYVKNKETALINVGYQGLSFLQGEMAIEHLENGLQQLEEEGLDPYEEIPILENLEKEMERRSLTNLGE